jgi:ATP-dependent Clp protease protease subunit
MNLQHFKEIENKMMLKIHDSIDMFSSEKLREDMEMMEEQGVKEIELSINSTGGEVFQGFSMISSIMNTEMKTTAVVEGVAMSMASLIALSADQVKMTDYSIMMIHDPSNGTSDKNMTDKQKELISKVKESLMTIYTNRTGMDKDKIDKMMSEETYLNSEEALEMGFVDEVITTKKQEPEAELIHHLINKVKSDYKSLNKEDKNKKNNMKDQKQELFTDQELDGKIENQYNELKTEFETLKNEKETLEESLNTIKEEKQTLENKLQEIKDKETEETKNKVETLLESYKETLSEEEYNKFHNIGMEDVSFLENTLSKFGVTKKTNKVDNDTKEAGEGLIDVRKMEKEDPKGLKKIKDENPALYKASFEATYNK